ncbi:E3 SUMO-protein ligase ZBED1 [Labeo rohita]|uniref:E3 SUMO-protein ligase ZBED1 n=1 Tax=Labeo rohita TaxID=84645 RepID=A0ABQ8LC16_LABRO|nr:E3 SUMO-protein ligase ZBED1 [Labeo rohita]
MLSPRIKTVSKELTFSLCFLSALTLSHAIVTLPSLFPAFSSKNPFRIKVLEYLHTCFKDTARRNPTADAVMEVRSYLEEPHIQRAEDPLIWWEGKALVYPRLVKRVFSKTGQIITERRNRISPSKLRHLIFLNANLH